MARPARVDLHLHTTASDGRLDPGELVELAHQEGVRVAALTDHDTTAGLPAAREAGARLGVEIISGVELSADIPGAEVHMLGLYLNEEDEDFQGKLAELRSGRVGRAERMVAKLAELDAPISWERVQQLAGGAAVGRPHVAQALLEAGHVQTIPEAFDRFISRSGPAYVERAKLSPVESIALIHSVQGLAVLAHPLEGAGCEGLLPELVQAGLDGLESYYQGYSAGQVRRLVGLARRHGLVPTGGSDFHGFPMSGMTDAANQPGSVDVPPGVVDRLLERRRRLFG
jgi:hypothetical protein